MPRRASAPKNLGEQARLEKNAAIKASAIATRLRRSTMVPKVYLLKIVDNRLNHVQREDKNRVFLEAKWLRNAALADEDFDPGYAKKHDYRVGVLVKGKGLPPAGVIEQRELTTLGSQIAQSVVQELINNRKALAARKKNGHRVGRLKFAREVRSIDLKQYQATYAVDVARSRVRVQGIRGWMRVRGLDQLPDKAEFSSAKLLRKPDGDYVAVTCYTPPVPEDFQPGTSIGLDMNVGRPIVLSDGREIAAYVEETDRLKRLQRKRSRQVKGSNNYAKTSRAIEREYQKIDQRKNDLANKVVADLLGYEHVYMQDEQLPGWKRRDGFVKGGKKIQHGILGRVKTKLVNHDRVTVLDRWVPTTAWCPRCHGKTEHHVSKRTYDCAWCGYHNPDRDRHSATNMELIATNPETYLLPVERGNVKPVENTTTDKSPDKRKPSSAKQEAASSSATP